MYEKGEIKVTFLQEFDPKRQSSLWYGGRVAKVEYAGYTFNLGAYGDVIATLFSSLGEELAYVKDKCNAGCFREMQEFIPDDKSLSAIMCTEEGKTLVLENNNWWEVLVDSPEGECLDYGWVCDSWDLSEALKEILETMDDFIHEEIMDKAMSV